MEYSLVQYGDYLKIRTIVLSFSSIQKHIHFKNMISYKIVENAEALFAYGGSEFDLWHHRAIQALSKQF